MSVRDVKNAFRTAAQDGRITKQEVDQVMRAAGTVSVDEEKAIKDEAAKYASQMDPDAASDVRVKLGQLGSLRRQIESQNRTVTRLAEGLTADATGRLAAGSATETFGGTQIPEAVKSLVREQLAAGATAYDVREVKADPVYDTSHGEPELGIAGKFNPYGQEARAVDSLAFDHTELTPDKIKHDLSTPQTWMEIAGYDRLGDRQVAKFKEVTGTPNGGRITELYDEASWPNTMARGPGGQKYASNFAVLADGSFHAVPASRRSQGNPGLILTTASLGRGKQMLFNGHLRMDNGVVNYVGMSGRLCKLQEKGEAKFVDPVALLKAWGFEVKPGLTVTNEG